MYPMSDPVECLDGLGKVRYRSKMDLASGFWQITLAPEASKVAAFIMR